MRQKREKGVVSLREQIRRDDEDQAEWEQGQRRRDELPMPEDEDRELLIGIGQLPKRDGRMHPTPRQCRTALALTLSPFSVDMMLYLCARYTLSRGRVADALFINFARDLDKKVPGWRDEMAELSGRVHKHDNDTENFVNRIERMPKKFRGED